MHREVKKEEEEEFYIYIMAEYIAWGSKTKQPNTKFI
jgi:hypothetical protein